MSMIDSNVRLSVIMPVSTVDDFFPQAINSILVQTFCDFELLVIANGVTDECYKILENISATDKRIRLFRLTIKGLAFALNYGVEHSAGDIIARMDSDDLSEPNRFELQTSFLDQNPSVGVVGGRVKLIDSCGNYLKDFPYYESNSEISRVLPYRNPICHAAIMIRKEVFLAHRGYLFGFMSEDHEFFLRLRNSGIHFHNLNSYVFSYRRHEAQVTNIAKAWDHFFEISAFMFMNLLKTRNFKFLIGMAVVFPPLRMLRQALRERKRNRSAL